MNNLVRIIPGIESNKAKQVYLETKKVGQSLVLVCLEEHAEAYVDLLSRQGTDDFRRETESRRTPRASRAPPPRPALRFLQGSR